MRKIIAVILGVLALLLIFAGVNLITLTEQFLLYLGGVLLLLAIIFFIKG